MLLFQEFLPFVSALAKKPSEDSSFLYLLIRKNSCFIVIITILIDFWANIRVDILNVVFIIKVK